LGVGVYEEQVGPLGAHRSIRNSRLDRDSRCLRKIETRERMKKRNAKESS